MEIHQHAHTPDPDLHRGRKKWTHYFWEFLMLFLAVFCGFLAEYQLEHKIEHNREKQLIKSLVEDIEADTAQLRILKSVKLNKLAIMDSVIQFFSKVQGTSVTASTYNLTWQLHGHVSFYQSSGTLDQLKNAGGFRLIRRRKVVDSIQGYDQLIKKMFLRDQFEAEEMRYTRRLAYQLFDGKDAGAIHADSKSLSILPPQAATLIRINQQNLSEYLNSLITFRFLIQVNLELQETIRKRCANLLEVIKEEYHLK